VPRRAGVDRVLAGPAEPTPRQAALHPPPGRHVEDRASLAVNDVDPRTRWPYLTAGQPPVPGAIKRSYEDFVVDEVPLYEPEGHGDHVFFRIEKEGLSTQRAVGDVARALGVRADTIGVAGLKDARAVTRQTLSVEHVEPERIEA